MRSQTASANKPAFTLIDLLLAIAIFAIMASVTLPFLGMFQQTQSIGTYAQSIEAALRDAELRAQNGQRGSMWGVSFQAHAYVLFAGSTYATHLPASDETHTVASSYTLSGPSEIDFQKVTGKPVSAGTIVVSDPGVGQESVTVNAEGGIDLTIP